MKNIKCHLFSVLYLLWPVLAGLMMAWALATYVIPAWYYIEHWIAWTIRIILTPLGLWALNWLRRDVLKGCIERCSQLDIGEMPHER